MGCRRILVAISIVSLLVTYCKDTISPSAFLTRPDFFKHLLPLSHLFWQKRSDPFWWLSQEFRSGDSSKFHAMRIHPLLWLKKMWYFYSTADKTGLLVIFLLLRTLKTSNCTLLKQKQVPTAVFHPFSHLCLEDIWQYNLTVSRQNSGKSQQTTNPTSKLRYIPLSALYLCCNK